MVSLSEYLETIFDLVLESKKYDSNDKDTAEMITDDILNIISSKHITPKKDKKLYNKLPEEAKADIDSETPISFFAYKLNIDNNTIKVGIIYSHSKNGNGNQCFKSKSNGNYFIVLDCKKDSSLEEHDDTIAHELQHFIDAISDLDGSKKINVDNYTKEMITKYSGFLYYTNPTEMNAYLTGFKKSLKKHDSKLVKILTATLNQCKEKNKNITCEEFVEAICKHMIKTRYDFMKSNDEKDINDNDKGKVENPLRILEYKFSILASLDNFKTFINFQEPFKFDGNKLKGTEERKDKEELKKRLVQTLKDYKVDVDDDTKIKNMYNEILEKYNEKYDEYIKLLKNKFFN